MLRRLVVVFVSLFSIAGAASARDIVDAGVVAVGLDGVSPTEHCTIGLDAELCAASYDDGGTPLSPGDDTVSVRKYVDAARVTLRPPTGGDDLTLEAQPSDLRVQHSAFTTLNETWIDANNTLPAPVKTFVTLDSRPMVLDPHPWGVFVTVHEPVSLNGETFDPAAGICWSWCTFFLLDPSGPVRSNETTVQLFPNNVWTQDWSSDAFLSTFVQLNQPLCEQPVPPAACAEEAPVQPTLDAAAAAAEAATPSLDLAVQFNRTILQWEPTPPPHQGGAQGAAPAAHPDANRGTRAGRLTTSEERAASPIAATMPWQAPIAHGAVASPTDAESSNAPAIQTAAVPQEPLPWAIGAAALGVAALLYHRLTRERALEQVTRRRIYDVIRNEPGIRLGTIAARMDLAYPTVEQHVRVLERFGLVSRTGTGQKRYYASGSRAPEELRMQIEILATPSVRAVFEFMRKHGQDADIGVVCDRLGLSPSTVSEAAARLCQAGVLERKRVQRRVRFKLACSAAMLGWFGRPGAPGPP